MGRLMSARARQRLRGFTFVLRRDEEEKLATFYELTEAAARLLAETWAQHRGWGVVERAAQSRGAS